MRLNSGWYLVEDWAATASIEDVKVARDTLLTLAEPDWAEQLEVYDDVTRRSQKIITMHSRLWLVIRLLADYPDVYNIVYIGDPDET